MDGRSFCSRAMRLVTHRMHAAGVNPTIIEVEQGTHGDGVVDGFIGEAYCVKGRDIRRADGHGVFIHLADEAEKGLVRIAKP